MYLRDTIEVDFTKPGDVHHSYRLIAIACDVVRVKS